MELFLLIKKESDFPEKLPESIREEFFDTDSLIREAGDYMLYVNKKTVAGSCIHYSNEHGSITGTGTFIYKSESPCESLKLLMEDLLEDRFDAGSLLGHYFIFLFLPSGIKLFTDGTGLVRAYHDQKGSYLASSFLLSARLHDRLTLNRDAATENLLTGGIIGSETLVNEISSFSGASFTLFPDIEFILPHVAHADESKEPEPVAIRRESERLDAWFRSCSRLAEACGADIGLTGGYDSRLVLAYARNNIYNLQVHSHFRPSGSEEWRIARDIAVGERIQFVSPEVTPPEEMDDEMLLRVMAGSFRFNDGIISLHCNWMEEYNTLEYRRKVLGEKQLGFSGIGGEQYRNHERLYGKPWLFRQWIKYSYLRKVSGKAFLRSSDEKKMLERIKTRINDIMEFGPGKRWMNLTDLKRIQNEVMIPAYRGVRTDAENKHAWHLSPLADFHISSSAYGIIKYLRDSKNFEAGLIRRISLPLAAYPTDYGYDLIKGEPLLKRILASAFENLLPGSLKWKIKEKHRSGGKSGMVPGKIRSSLLLKGYVDRVTSLGLPVSVTTLVNRDSTAHLVISLGYFLERLKITTER